VVIDMFGAIGLVTAGGRGSVKQSRKGVVKGMKNKRKAKKRLAKEAEILARMEKARRKNESNYYEEFLQYDWYDY